MTELVPLGVVYRRITFSAFLGGTKEVRFAVNTVLFAFDTGPVAETKGGEVVLKG